MTNDIAARLGRVLCSLLLLLAALAVARPAQAQRTPTPEPTRQTGVERSGDRRFGVIESFEDPAAADRLGATWTRARFQWAEVQPDGPAQWEPPLDDEALDAELAAGREVVGLLIGIPDWARDRRGLPRGLSLPAGDPDNTWGVFVAEAVGRYAGRIDRWIIWNEPDIDDPDAPGHTWDGDIEQFAQLQRVAYLAAKEANPDAVIHLGAFTYFWDPGYFDRFLDVLAADPDAAANDFYFDAATAHLYFQPNAVYNVLYAFRQVMADHGLDKPIWLVETNAPPMNDPYWVVPNWTLAVSLGEQAAFIPQALAAALSAGAERVAVYKLKDTAGDRVANPEPFGLMRWDESRRPAFDTYRVAIRLLGDVTAAERQRWDAVGQVRLTQPGQTTTVLFARLPDSQTVRVPATADTAEWVSMWGGREEIEAEDGYFTVELPGALCRQTIADYCMIGGTTYYLIQENAPARAAQLAATRDAAATRAAVPTGRAATRQAASTATALAPEPTATPRPSATATAAPSATATVAATTTAVVATLPPTATATPTSAAAADGVAIPPPSTLDTPPAQWSVGDNAGLILIGLGLLLAAGLVGRRLVGRRAQ
ncbi:MAG: hypothetical protein IPH95_06230 [Candidatus Promineofilum sp.]|nr:hypothetical protein [Promineifilum sp.]